MDNLVLQAITRILNQNSSIDEPVVLVDSTDNGSFYQAEIQCNGVWLGDVDIESIMNVPFIDAVLILKNKAALFHKHYSEAVGHAS